MLEIRCNVLSVAQLSLAKMVGAEVSRITSAVAVQRPIHRHLRFHWLPARSQGTLQERYTATVSAFVALNEQQVFATTLSSTGLNKHNKPFLMRIMRFPKRLNLTSCKRLLGQKKQGLGGNKREEDLPLFCLLWIAVNSNQSGILKWVVGDRSLTTFRRLWWVVRGWCYFLYTTDGYPVYPCLIDVCDHLVSKTAMTRVEGENSRLRRHYLARLHRKTFCYSKSQEMLEASIRLLIYYLKHWTIPLLA